MVNPRDIAGNTEEEEEDPSSSALSFLLSSSQPARWPSGKASASRAEDPGFESCMRRDFFGVEPYQ